VCCPECGKSFDPTNPKTYRKAPPRLWVRSIFRFTVRTGLAGIILAGLGLSVLIFANPQWNKQIYMFQAYVYPVHKRGWIAPPSDYTGQWKVWDPDGKLLITLPYKDGKLHGYVNGPAILPLDDPEDDGGYLSNVKGRFINGKREGPFVEIGWKYGTLFKGNYRNGKRHGNWSRGASILSSAADLQYKDGELIGTVEEPDRATSSNTSPNTSSEQETQSIKRLFIKPTSDINLLDTTDQAELLWLWDIQRGKHPAYRMPYNPSPARPLHSNDK